MTSAPNTAVPGTAARDKAARDKAALGTTARPRVPVTLPLRDEAPRDAGPAVLVLQDGAAFRGEAWGAQGQALGEAVFNTGMTGYQETLTDPSYHRQIVVMTAPHVGNTGVNDEDGESGQIWVAGFVVRDPSRLASSWRAGRTLDAELIAQGVIGISGIDTRALTRHLRERGAMNAGIFSGEALVDEAGRERLTADLAAIVSRAPQMAGAHLASDVSAPERYVIDAHVPDGAAPLGVVAAIDLGIKSMTPYRMAERGLEVHVLPASTTPAELAELSPDGVFFSNGPGDPAAADDAVALLRWVLDHQIPFFGICFGNQLLGRALGFGTYKLGYGHRGINRPVLNRATGKVEITSQNHGFAIDIPVGDPVTAPYGDGKYGRAEVSHVDLNDNVVEGIRCLDIPAFSVQYHPEAAAGPHDAGYLFDTFAELIVAATRSEMR